MLDTTSADITGGKKDRDTWQRKLATIRDKIGAEFANYVSVERAIHENKTVTKIVVDRSHHPVHIEKKDLLQDTQIIPSYIVGLNSKCHLRLLVRDTKYTRCSDLQSILCI